jgi:hypothetical protein
MTAAVYRQSAHRRAIACKTLLSSFPQVCRPNLAEAHGFTQPGQSLQKHTGAADRRLRMQS